MSVISDELVSSYHDEGWVVVPDVLPAHEIAAISRVTDEFVERSRALRADADGLELAAGHTQVDPRLRRINAANTHHPLYRDLLRHPRVLEVVTSLIGDDVRFHHSKLTLKLARHGEAVEWHQDWAFYPHTNDSVLEVGILIDPVEAHNGPLMVVPGSHRGPIFDHHSEGRFCGAVGAEQLGPLAEQGVPMLGPAGSLTVHHVRTLHGAAPNLSGRSRRMLFMGFTAADAWPLAGMGSGSVNPGYLFGDIVSGRAAPVARMEALPVRLPFPLPDTLSLYGIQNTHPDRVFTDVSR
jgi:phytanoyl-CoA hydroxylase